MSFVLLKHIRKEDMGKGRVNQFVLAYCFATMRSFPRKKTHDSEDHAWFIFNLHTENSIFMLHTTT
jgi:hypothetical protein